VAINACHHPNRWLIHAYSFLNHVLFYTCNRLSPTDRAAWLCGIERLKVIASAVVKQLI
jgi:hypothetical protein